MSLDEEAPSSMLPSTVSLQCKRPKPAKLEFIKPYNAIDHKIRTHLPFFAFRRTIMATHRRSHKATKRIWNRHSARSTIFHRFTNKKTFFSAQSTTKKSTHPKDPRAENEMIETPGIELKHLVTYKSRKFESRIRTYNTPCINDNPRCTTTESSRVPHQHQMLTETDKL